MQTDANQTIKDVTAADRSQGGDAAFKKLMQEYNDYKHLGATEDQLKQFTKQVDQGLVDDKVLPDLAISWAMSDTAKRMSENGSEFTRYDLRTISTTPNFQGDSQIDQDMAEALLKNYDHVKDATVEPDWLGRDSDNITQKDLSHEQKITDARALLGPMMQGNPPLWQVLDSSKDGSPDGTITRDDLQRYLFDYNNVTEYGADPTVDNSPYSKSNYDYVKDLYYNYDSPTAQFLRGAWGGEAFTSPDGSYKYGPNANFDIDQVARVTGFGDLAHSKGSCFELQKRYREATPPAPAEEEPASRPSETAGSGEPICSPRSDEAKGDDLIKAVKDGIKVWAPSEVRAVWQQLTNFATEHKQDILDGIRNGQPNYSSVFNLPDDQQKPCA